MGMGGEGGFLIATYRWRARMYRTVLEGKLLVIYNKEGRCASGRTKAVRCGYSTVTVATGACPDTEATHRYTH